MTKILVVIYCTVVVAVLVLASPVILVHALLFDLD